MSPIQSRAEPMSRHAEKRLMRVSPPMPTNFPFVRVLTLTGRVRRMALAALVWPAASGRRIEAARVSELRLSLASTCLRALVALVLRGSSHAATNA